MARSAPAGPGGLRFVPAGVVALLIAAAAGAQAVPPAPATTGSALVDTVAAWASTDAGGQAFAVVDKPAAQVFVFDRGGRLVGGAPVLLGLARGDGSSPGVGDRPLSAIRPADRTTPAGRFEAKPDLNAAGHRILWLDYGNAISMHAVVTGNKSEHRLQRLQTPSIADNRISYGCINVPAAFFANVMEPMFASGGVVYVLPDVERVEEVLPALGRFIQRRNSIAGR